MLFSENSKKITLPSQAANSDFICGAKTANRTKQQLLSFANFETASKLLLRQQLRRQLGKNAAHSADIIILLKCQIRNINRNVDCVRFYNYRSMFLCIEGYKMKNGEDLSEMGRFVRVFSFIIRIVCENERRNGLSATVSPKNVHIVHPDDTNTFFS